MRASGRSGLHTGRVHGFLLHLWRGRWAAKTFLVPLRRHALPLHRRNRKFGYRAKVVRYAAQEMAPFGKGNFNYMAKGTKEDVTEVSEAFFEGMSKGLINEDDFEEQKDRILSEI